MWRKVLTESDAAALMHAFEGFHDSCILNLIAWGGYYVSPNLHMTCPPTPDLRCKIFVQRQAQMPSSVELLFAEVVHLSLAAPANYDRIILSATLHVTNEQIVWSPDSDFSDRSYEFGLSSAIVARRMWWRPVENGLGKPPAANYLTEYPVDLEP